MTTLNDTHDPRRRSWVETAAGSDFPIQNLPLGVFGTGDRAARGGVAIGDRILDFAAAVEAGLFAGDAEQAARAAAGPALNPLMALGNDAASALRAAVSDLLTEGSAMRAKTERCLVAAAETAPLLPAEIGSFTDFLCFRDHARRMSPKGALPPVFDSIPLAYHGRASSVRVSGTPYRRPRGQFADASGVVRFGPEPAQDFELELGIFVGRAKELGRPLPIAAAPQHLFGFCLLNDWSARGIQFRESRPLGPFLGKSAMTTISPWIVTAEAMAPFAVPAVPRAAGAEAPAHLVSAADQVAGGLDIDMFAEWSTAAMRARGAPPRRVVVANFRHCYWTPAQMLAHQASNGCDLASGDLLGSGTVSGPEDGARACLAEINARGGVALDIGGDRRVWLEDGDEIGLAARARRGDHATIGFGACSGRVAPAFAWPSAHSGRAATPG